MMFLNTFLLGALRMFFETADLHLQINESIYIETIFFKPVMFELPSLGLRSIQELRGRSC